VVAVQSAFAHLPNLVTVFLGIFLEALPFLLFGVLISSAIDVLVTPKRLARWLPRNAVVGLFGGVALGAAAPLCECGTVPIARGSISKGLPLPSAIGFLLAAPAINPITVAHLHRLSESAPDRVAAHRPRRGHRPSRGRALPALAGHALAAAGCRS
jgi:uncharacterized membrane protein YraQ (UPF0718 family)